LTEIVAKRADFGATDKPLSKEDQDKFNLVQFPMVIGGVVPVVNIKNIVDGQLHLTGPVLADIFLGKITRWNDARITELNRGLALPTEVITVINRASQSGTTFILTNYLSKVSQEWKNVVGEGLTVNWKVGVLVHDHTELISKLTETPNSIACLDYTDVKKSHLTGVKMQNREGLFVGASTRAFSAAAESVKWRVPNGFAEILTDQPNKESWPLTTATFILLDRTTAVPGRIKEMLSFFDWAYRAGDETALGLNYAPLSEHLKDLVRGGWTAHIKDINGNAVWP
jgi:phosphate transport system substrate-binding protein